tara:strand:- start:214 stop:609 length:396 start_codon:yes stop_codon:yes gene_type:complete
MASLYKNITGNSAKALGAIDIKSMTLTNVHATDSVGVQLYITSHITQSTAHGLPIGNDWTLPEQATTNTYYIFKNITIPYGVTLVLNKEDIGFDNFNYTLFIQLSASDSAVDIAIKKDNNKNNKSNTFNQY